MGWVSKHRTKLVGLAQTSVGAVLTYLPQLQSSMKPTSYGMVLMAVGVSTSALGFFNSWVQEKPDVDKS